MIRFNRYFLILGLILGLGSQATFAANDQNEVSEPSKKVIYPMNGGSGFVFQQLKSVSDINSLAYDMMIVDSSRALSDAQMKQVQAALEKGLQVVIDGKDGAGTAQKVVEKLVGFGIKADAIMVVKNDSSKGGYNVTPITYVAPKPAAKNKKAVDSTFENSKAVDSNEEVTSNTVNDIFGL